MAVWCSSVILICGLTIAAATYNARRFNQKQRDIIVNLHNEFRRQLGASNMRELTWSEENELELLTTSGMSDCYVHTRFWEWDLNKFFMKRTSTNFNATVALQTWFDERTNNIDGFSCKEDDKCDNFWRAAYSESTTIGCGMNYCQTLDTPDGVVENAWLFGCKYNPSRSYFFQSQTETVKVFWEDQFLFKNGLACSECGEQLVCKQGLCAEQLTTPATEVTPVTVPESTTYDEKYNPETNVNDIQMNDPENDQGFYQDNASVPSTTTETPTTPEDYQEDIPEPTPENIFEGIQYDVPDTTPEPVPEVIPDTTPESVPENNLEYEYYYYENPAK